MMSIAEFLTVKQVEAIMQLSGKSVYRRISSGKLPAFKEGGRLLVLKSDLEAYLAKQVSKRRAV